jgi:hypothetical protein
MAHIFIDGCRFNQLIGPATRHFPPISAIVFKRREVLPVKAPIPDLAQSLPYFPESFQAPFDFRFQAG